MGIEPRGILPLNYTLSPIFLFFILKQGLTKLQRASQVPEAGREPATLQFQPPKYWDYKRVLPHMARVLFSEHFIIFAKLGGLKMWSNYGTV